MSTTCEFVVGKRLWATTNGTRTRNTSETNSTTGIHKFNAEFEAMMKMDKFFDENDDDLLKDVKLDL